MFCRHLHRLSARAPFLHLHTARWFRYFGVTVIVTVSGLLWPLSQVGWTDSALYPSSTVSSKTSIVGRSTSGAVNVGAIASQSESSTSGPIICLHRYFRDLHPARGIGNYIFCRSGIYTPGFVISLGALLSLSLPVGLFGPYPSTP